MSVKAESQSATSGSSEAMQTLFDEGAGGDWKIRNHVGIERMSSENFPTHANSDVSIQSSGSIGVRLDTLGSAVTVQEGTQFLDLYLYWNGPEPVNLDEIFLRFEEAQPLRLNTHRKGFYVNGDDAGKGRIELPSKQWVNIQIDMGLDRMGAQLNSISIQAQEPDQLFVDDITIRSGLHSVP